MKTRLWALGCGLLVALTLAFVTENDKVTNFGYPRSTVVYVSSLAFFLWAALLLGSFWASVYGLVKLSRLEKRGFIPLFVGIACGVFGFLQSMDVLAAYQATGSYIASDGREYQVLEESFWQGYDVGIARVKRRTPFGTWYEFVSGPQGDNAQHVKLSSPLPPNTVIARTEGGVLVAVSWGKRVFVGFDPKSGIVYGDPNGDRLPLQSRINPIDLLSTDKLVGYDARLERD